LDGITVDAASGVNNLTASTGTYDNGTWTPEGATSSVTLTPSAAIRVSSLTVNYTPDEDYTPDVPDNSPIEATPIDNLASYSGNDPYVYDQKTMKYYALNSAGEYEEYGLFPEVSTLDIPGYEGKMVVYDGGLYEYTGGEFAQTGKVTYEAVRDLGPEYRNLSNWNYPGPAYDATFGVNVFDEETGSNTLNPYEGKGGWEPLSYKITGLTEGNEYRLTFTYTGTAWHSWSNYTTLPFFVIDSENMPSNEFNDPNAALAHIALPNTETTEQPYSALFTAAHDYALLCIQFGVVDDNSHDPAFAFTFTDIKVQKRVLPNVAYREITWADVNKYTPLAYIESNSASRENAFTLPYNPVTATQIDAKFQVYDSSNGWCGIFSARNTYAGTGISLYMNGNNKKYFGYFTGGTTGSGDEFAPFSVNTDYEVTADVTKLIVNGEEYLTGNSVTNATTRNLSLFANPEWDNPMRGRFYYCTISEQGERIYDFQPVMRHDGVFGFYDKASRVFVLPAQNTLDGYGYAMLEDQAYITYSKETRPVIVGSTAQFLPEVQNLDNVTFTWTSSDESIATVAADGTVTGIANGKVTITATTDADGGWTASYELTVSEPNYVRHDANGVGYAIVTGGNGWNDSPLSALIDNDATTKFGCSGSGDAWAIIVASEAVAVKQYSFVTGADTYNWPARNPRSWKIEGSNDNQNWTVIDEHNDYDAYKIHSVNKEEFTFTVNGTETYKFFKFSAGTTDGFQLGELWINEQTHTWGEPTEEASTCTVQGKKVWECTDCKVLKTELLPLAEHTYVNGVCSDCGAKYSEQVLLANGQTNPYAIKFRHQAGVSEDEYVDIEEGWNAIDFDDSEWDELIMPLGSNGY
ncbi:MAG: Ig-like domain-containing protein, partial [Prevotellaceae bacterium]|nr:Ig-like domain-containing protein [Prevotellaceae bacterium]